MLLMVYHIVLISNDEAPIFKDDFLFLILFEKLLSILQGYDRNHLARDKFQTHFSEEILYFHHSQML